jgi:hypothetical protein
VPVERVLVEQLLVEKVHIELVVAEAFSEPARRYRRHSGALWFGLGRVPS